jgi:hypothetical protein
MNGAAPSSAQHTNCEMMLQVSNDRWAPLAAGMPPAVAQHERVLENERVIDAYQNAYEMSFEVPGDAVSSWSDTEGNLGARTLAPLFAAGALVLLVACARGASRLLDATHGQAIAAGSAIGALVVAAILINGLGLPALGIRAIAFAVCASLLAAKFARTARRNLVLAAA